MRRLGSTLLLILMAVIWVMPAANAASTETAIPAPVLAETMLTVDVSSIEDVDCCAEAEAEQNDGYSHCPLDCNYLVQNLQIDLHRAPPALSEPLSRTPAAAETSAHFRPPITL